MQFWKEREYSHDSRVVHHQLQRSCLRYRIQRGPSSSNFEVIRPRAHIALPHWRHFDLERRQKLTNGEDNIPLRPLIVDIEKLRSRPRKSQRRGSVLEHRVKRGRIECGDVEVESGGNGGRVLHVESEHSFRVRVVELVPGWTSEHADGECEKEGKENGNSRGGSGSKAMEEW